MTTLFTANISNSSEIRDCQLCHKVSNYDEHRKLACIQCHPKNEKHFSKGDILDEGASGCLNCHKEYKDFVKHQMHTKAKEIKYVKDKFDRYDNNFYKTNCNSCHVTSCSDCHINKKFPHKITKNIDNNNCLKCHKGYFTGIEYLGLAEKDDAEKFQIGEEKDGTFYQKMLPDIHFEKGLKCIDCHNMKGFLSSKKTTKSCKDCHKKVSNNVIEHSIKSHLEKLECYTCHSAWSQNELGTFFLKFKDKSSQKPFEAIKNISQNYKKTSYMKNNFETFIGIDNNGKYSIIRPFLISFITFVSDNKTIRISSDWRIKYSHTIRKETVLCHDCHENRKKYILLKPEDDYMDIKKDNFCFDSFYNQKNMFIVNGRFVSEYEWNKINNKSDEYKKLFIKKQMELIGVVKKAR